VVAESAIPIEEGDTLESLRLKADIRGATLYHDSIRRIACGERFGKPQHGSRANTFRAPSEYKVWTLQRQLSRRAGRPATSLVARTRVALEFALLLPWLQHVKRRLLRER